MSNIGRPHKNTEAVASFTASFNRLKTEHAVTNRDIADALGIKHQSQVVHWSGGHGLPNKANQKRLADFFNVSIPTLLGMEGKTLMEILVKE